MDSHREVVIVHSSDLHLGTDDSFSDADRLVILPKVLTVASEASADIVVLAGERKSCATMGNPSSSCRAITIL